MKPRFEPYGDGGDRPVPPPILMDPEAYDASEEHFAASLEEKAARPQFVPEPAEEIIPAGSPTNEAVPQNTSLAPCPPQTEQPSPTEIEQPTDEDSWRHELQAKISDYRARKRPRPPRYPSLQLKFDSSESYWSGSGAGEQHAVSDPVAAENLEKEEVFSQVLPASPSSLELNADTGRVLEFPRLEAQAPVRDELAEPVFEEPPILETPEILPPPPALGGILIEPPAEPVTERRLGLDLPLQAASMSRRVLALGIDGLLVILGTVLFAYIFFKITSSLPPLRQIALACSGIVVCFWAGYQYLLLVYAGTTPGLRLSKLRLSRFDGRGVPQGLRRWRVLASILSGLSLGLGYAWCFFDEDQLCWHDRITHTYMAPGRTK